MTATPTTRLADLRGSRARFAVPASASAWTGRSTVSSATGSALPRLTAGRVRRTRVSEMRIAAPAPSGAGAATAQRRGDRATA